MEYKNQLDGFGKEYIEDDPNGYNMQEVEEDLKNIKKDLELQKKIIEEAHKNGYAAEYQEDTKKVVIESDKNFKMSVPVKKNHAFAIINETSEYKKKKKAHEQATYDKLVKTIAKGLNELEENARKQQEKETKKMEELLAEERIAKTPDPYKEMKEEKKTKRDIREKEQTKNDQEETIVKQEHCGQLPIPVNNNEANKSSKSLNSSEYIVEEI